MEATRRAGDRATGDVHVPWECDCGEQTTAPPFKVPEGWMIERSEKGTDSDHTLCSQAVLCPSCVAITQVVRRGLRRTG